MTISSKWLHHPNDYIEVSGYISDYIIPVTISKSQWLYQEFGREAREDHVPDAMVS